MKKVAIFSLILLSQLAMGCNAATSDQYKTAAKADQFSVEQDVVHEDTYYATKQGCRIAFYEKANASEAKALFDQTEPDRKHVLQTIGSKQESKKNFFQYHHHEIKTASTLIYATHYQNTFLYFSGSRNCDEYVERLAEKLGFLY